ncbi:MAG: NAD(P)H-dependent oxidoreductase [bacterium]
MKIHIIISTTRDGRSGEGVANWAKSQIDKLGHEGIVVDLRDHEMPFLDTSVSPFGLNKKYPHKSVQKWSDLIDDAEAFLFVLAEYNHGYPAVLKNALDWLGAEWSDKPAAILSHSAGHLGGARATEQLKLVLNGLGVIMATLNVALGDVRSTDGSDINEKAADQIPAVIKNLEKLLVVSKTQN